MGTDEQKLLGKLLDDASFINWAKNKNKNDLEYWNNWIGDHPQNIEVIENAKAIVSGIRFTEQLPNEKKISREWAKVLAHIEDKREFEPQKSGKNGKNKIPLAAAAIVLILISWSGFRLFENFSTTVHKTGYGEIIDLKLPDGTSVVLNGNSEIRYEKNRSRDIHLKGESYFKVKPVPSTNAKFWVHTDDLKVEVLGTRFHVNTRKEKTKVVLDEGSIHLEFINGEVKKMVPGEIVSFSKYNDKAVHKKVAVSTPYAFWKDGTYTFNEIPLGEVMQNLEYTYGIEVKYESDKLEGYIITGGVPNQNLDICITAIERATNTRIIHKNNTLLIQENLNN